MARAKIGAGSLVWVELPEGAFVGTVLAVEEKEVIVDLQPAARDMETKEIKSGFVRVSVESVRPVAEVDVGD